MMEVKIIDIDGSKIKDHETFHEVFQDTLGFPKFYGRNMDAWNDCMGDLDADSGMTKITVQPGGMVILKINNANDFKNNAPEEYKDLIECTAFVNFARIGMGQDPILSLMLIAHFKR